VCPSEREPIWVADRPLRAVGAPDVVRRALLCVRQGDGGRADEVHDGAAGAPGYSIVRTFGV
jgi:hypothetical protein